MQANTSLLHPVTETTPFVVISVVKVLAVFSAVMVIVALLTLMERKVSAWMQDRLGPNRVGPGGIGQPLADGIKNILKEETNPAEANRVFFTLAPMLSIIPALVTFCVIPLASPLPTPWGVVPMVVADLPIGILFLMAFSSLGVYGIVIAGWASFNKYALLGGLRAGAQMISYEIALGLSLMSVFFVTGNVTISEMIWRQQEMNLWFGAMFSVSFLFFWISSFAETNRLPFDLPEAESELVTGYHTEYSAMKFSMFFIAEYSHVLTVSMLMAAVFLGGWDIPGTSWDDMMGFDAQGQWVGAVPSVLKTLLTFVFFVVKTFAFILIFMLVRWTVPRFRYDQVMDLGWKVLLPASLVAVIVTSATVLLLDDFGPAPTELLWGIVPAYGLILAAVNFAMLMAVMIWIDRMGVVTGTGGLTERRLAARELARRHRARMGARQPVAGD
jgi:NADH-quinone oxidoreductase subunit H